jgi:hypothetical protein
MCLLPRANTGVTSGNGPSRRLLRRTWQKFMSTRPKDDGDQALSVAFVVDQMPGRVTAAIDRFTH